MRLIRLRWHFEVRSDMCRRQTGGADGSSGGHMGGRGANYHVSGCEPAGCRALCIELNVKRVSAGELPGGGDRAVGSN